MKKKIIIFLGLLMLVQGVYVIAMKTPIKKKKKSEKVKLFSSAFIPMYNVQKPYAIKKYYGGKRVVKKGTDKKVWGELINLTETDPITQSSFLALIKEKHTQGLPYIMAVLTVEEGAARYARRYQDAGMLVNWMFNAKTFDRLPNKNKHVLTQQQILKSIQFFILYPKQKAFEYLGSEKQLKKDFVLKSLLRIEAGKAFDIDMMNVAYDYLQKNKPNLAITYLKPLIEKNNLAALDMVAEIYDQQGDYVSAEKYWKIAADKKYVPAIINLVGLFLGNKTSKTISVDQIGIYYKNMIDRNIELQANQDKWKKLTQQLKQKYPQKVEQWNNNEKEIIDYLNKLRGNNE